MSKAYNQGFRQLKAWQLAYDLTLQIYAVTKDFPALERYGLADQLRRAASSTCAQIAEGSRMKSLKHRYSYYERAYASNAEVDCFMELAKDLSYIGPEKYAEILHTINIVGLMTYRLKLSAT